MLSAMSWMAALAIKVEKNKAHKDRESSKLPSASSILSFLVSFQSEDMVQTDWRDKGSMKKGTCLSASQHQCSTDRCSETLDDFWTESWVPTWQQLAVNLSCFTAKRILMISRQWINLGMKRITNSERPVSGTATTAAIGLTPVLLFLLFHKSYSCS